jgi:hypothetical protein
MKLIKQLTQLLESKQPYEMSRSEFINANRSNFVTQKGQRVIVGVQISPSTIYRLPREYQRNGKLLKPVDDILSEMYDDIIAQQEKRYANRNNPHAYPWEKSNTPPYSEVIDK